MARRGSTQTTATAAQSVPAEVAGPARDGTVRLVNDDYAPEPDPFDDDPFGDREREARLDDELRRAQDVVAEDNRRWIDARADELAGGVEQRATLPTAAPPLPTLEERAAALGVPSLDTLHDEKQRLVNRKVAKMRERASLQARRDVFDARRKSQRGLITAVLVAKAKKEGGRVPAAETLEMLASGDKDYVAFLDNSEQAFTTLYLCDAEIEDLTQQIAAVTDKILRARDLLRLAAAEAWLERGGPGGAS